MPVNNAACVLDESIESLWSQTFEDWELIIIDDGSTDTSVEIAESYARRDPCKIRTLKHPDSANHGVSGSLNLGISEARGDAALRQHLAF
jgi:glycosyltransferase involved in cell wall biosynthesis